MQTEFKVRRKCPYCKKMMGFICKCGSYQVTEETHHLPLKEQPYMKVQFSGELMSNTVKKFTMSEYREYLKQDRLGISDDEIEDIISRLKNKKIFR